MKILRKVGVAFALLAMLGAPAAAELPKGAQVEMDAVMVLD